MSFARAYRVGVWFHFVWSALLLTVVAYVVLSFEAMPGLCCFLRVTPLCMYDTSAISNRHRYRVVTGANYIQQ